MDGANESLILTDPVDSAACPKCGAMLSVEGLPAFSEVQCPSCGFEFQVPARFGTFMLLQMLGAGGMGGVYRARDEALNREVAIKVMLKSLGDDPQFVETFQREAQAAAKLNHPHIAQIYSFGQEKGQPYIAMELVSGGSLDKMMAEQGPMDPTVVIHIGEQIADGLREAADAGMVHGDVKPENILFDNDKNAKLVDFGLSAMASGPGHEVWGTPYYIAPEKVRRQKSDFRSDIYSLGGTLYHAIAGVPPFEGADATAVVKARFEGAPKKMGEIRKGVSAEVEALIGRMLEVEPQLRYPTYGSLLGDMRRYLAKAGPVKMERASKKIMIKGKHGGMTGKMTTGAMSPTGVFSAVGANASGAGGELPEGMVPVSEVEEVPESEEAARKRGAKMLLKGVGGVAAVILLMAGVVIGFMYHTKSSREKAAAASIARSQAAARASIAKSLANASVIVDRIQKYVPEAMDYAKAAADEAVKALGEEARASMVPPEPSEAEMTAAMTAVMPDAAAAPAAVSNIVAAVAAGQTGALSNMVAAVAGKAGSLSNLTAAVAAGKGGALSNMVAAAAGQAGSLSNLAAAVAAGNMANLANAAAALAGNAAAPAEIVSAAAAPAEGGDQNPVIAIVRGMYADAYAVKAASLRAGKLFEEMEKLSKTAESMTRVDKAEAEALVKLNNDLVERVNNLGSDRQINEVPRKVSQLKRSLDSVRTDVASLIEVKRQAEIAKEKQRKAEAEAEKKRQKDDAHKAKVEAELKKVADAEEAHAAAIKELNFRDVIRELKDMSDELDTPQGQDALATALERVNRIKDFHEYLVKHVPGYKSARGWSVSAADNKTLTVGTTRILWTEVYAKRLDIVGELINGLVRDEQATKSLRLREKTRVMTNAALCLSLFYKDMSSAQELAKTLATDAAREFDVDADIIKQLLPECFN